MSIITRLQNQIWAYLEKLMRLPKGAFPKVSTIAARLGCSIRSVQYALRRFRELNWLVVIRRGPTSSLYKLKPQPTAEQLCISFCVSPPILSESEPESTSGVYSTVVPETEPAKQQTPPPTTLNQPRPIPERIWGVVIRAMGRIQKAKNPDAYRQAIINCELRLEAQRATEAARKKPVPQPAQTWTKESEEWKPGELSDHLQALGLL